MSDIVRTNKDINIASGDFAKKLREALGQDEPRGGEIALRREADPSGVATTISLLPRSNGPLGEGVAWQPTEPPINISMTVSFIGPVTFSATLFGKSVV